jgi:prepilin-type N-terminal cleavage/methylation domain-containing protein
MRKSFQRGLTLLELLVVMAIIAIIAAMATTNYFIALTRAKQKRTMADIRMIALAWETRAVETQSYRVSGYTFPTQDVPYATLRNALMPTYTKSMPQLDGWNRPLEFAFDAEGGGIGSYAIRSAGRDGNYDPAIVDGATHDPDCDIVFSNGSFVQFPEVMQSQ